MPSRIIVLGMFRSGTSLNAKLVQCWGAYVGSEGDLFGDRYGYLEHLGLQKLNDELMDHNDRVPPLSELLVAHSQAPIYKERALQLLDLMDRQAEEREAVAWVWKDPRLPMVLPFWANLWGDVIYVITVRHPVETVSSAAEMDGVSADSMALSAGLVYWQYNMLNVLAFTQGSWRKIFMAFDQLISDPTQECRRLCRFLDEQCGRQPGGADERIDALVSQVQASKRHYREPRSLAETARATREQRALYNFLRVKTLYPDEAFNKDDFALYPAWRDYLRAMDMLTALTRTQEA